MSDDSHPKKSVFKQEWKIFWEGLLGEEGEVHAVLPEIAPDQINLLIKNLSENRKRLNQRLEAINREIEESAAKLESLKLVGGDIDETVAVINQMNDEGESLSQELDRVNRKLEKARRWQDQPPTLARN